MSKEELCEKVRKMCENSGEEFLFIVDGKSCWSITDNEHIRAVAYYHKSTEDNKVVKGVEELTKG